MSFSPELHAGAFRAAAEEKSGPGKTGIQLYTEKQCREDPGKAFFNQNAPALTKLYPRILSDALRKICTNRLRLRCAGEAAQGRACALATP